MTSLVAASSTSAHMQQGNNNKNTANDVVRPHRVNPENAAFNAKLLDIDTKINLLRSQMVFFFNVVCF
jgi:hypothetical protein